MYIFPTTLIFLMFFQKATMPDLLTLQRVSKSHRRLQMRKNLWYI